MRTALRGIGQTLITLGLVILLFCAYEVWFTNYYTARQQDRLLDDLRAGWVSGVDPVSVHEVPIGKGIAVLRIPRLGSGWAKVVVEGVSRGDLKKGPGHYPGTALPGEVGNFVVSGHRTTYGAPFARLDEVRPGDAVVVETRATWFTYIAAGREIVRPRDVQVTYPVPGSRDAVPTQQLLTFTTCHPKYSARQRLVLRARLTSALPKTGGLPPALREG